MIATIPFRPKAENRFRIIRRVHEGCPSIPLFPKSSRPRTASVYDLPLCTSIIRSWRSEDDVRACTLCQRGCAAKIQKSGGITCEVYGPPGLLKEDAAGFRCVSPRQHFETRPAPETPAHYVPIPVRPGH